MLTNKINTVLLHPVNKHISNFFTVIKCITFLNQIKKILKTLIHRNILLIDPNKKKLIYYNKFKTSNLVIKNNSSPSIGVLKKNNVYIYIYIYIYIMIIIMSRGKHG